MDVFSIDGWDIDSIQDETIGIRKKTSDTKKAKRFLKAFLKTCTIIFLIICVTFFIEKNKPEIKIKIQGLKDFVLNKKEQIEVTSLIEQEKKEFVIAKKIEPEVKITTVTKNPQIETKKAEEEIKEEQLEVPVSSEEEYSNGLKLYSVINRYK